MEGGGRQSRLLSRLLGRLRGEAKLSPVEREYSFTSAVLTVKPSPLEAPAQPSMSHSTCGSGTDDISARACSNAFTMLDDDQFGNIDLRYGGQYLTSEQLPEFCDQLHNLVQVIRNIQSYATVTGEYPRELERRLDHEAREVAALAAEARNAREVTARVWAQRRALRKHREHVRTHLSKLKDAEVRELESSVRLSDRKLYKNWEAIKDTADPAAFDSLVQEVKNKQVALECLLRLIDSKRSSLSRQPSKPTPLPPPDPKDNNDESSAVSGSARRRHDTARRKRRRRSPRSAPLSEESSRHAPPTPDPPAPAQVTLYIQGSESTSRYRVGSTGAVTLTPLELPSGGSVRDILFFTTSS